jgi:glutamine amidotransferase
VPTLGICLGMQVFGSASEEGSRLGLGWLTGRTVRFRPPAGAERFRVPHIGWSRIARRRASPLLDGLDEDAAFYYVHSYHLADGEEVDTLAVTEYGTVFPAIVQHRNLVGAQFHPERSGAAGKHFLANFLRMRPGE